MRAIQQYQLELVTEQTLELPEGSFPRSVAFEVLDLHGMTLSLKLLIWVEVPDTNAPVRERHVLVVSNADPIPAGYQGLYVGTAFHQDTALHVYWTG